MEKNPKGFWKVVVYVFSFMKDLSKNLKLRIAVSMVFMLITISINIVTPLCLKLLTEHFATEDKLNFYSITGLLLVSYGAIWTIGQITSQARDLMIVRPLSSLVRLMNLAFTKHLLNLSMRFHAFKQTGSIVAAIKQAQNALLYIVWGILVSILPVVLELFLVLGFTVISYGFSYALFVLCAFLIYTVYSVFSARMILKSQQEYDKAGLESAGKIADTLLNMENIKYFGNYQYEIEQCDAFFARGEVAEGNFYKMMEISHLGQAIIIGLGLLITVTLSGLLVINKVLIVSDFIMINSYVLQLVKPLMSLSKYIREVRKAVADMQAYMNIMDLKPEIKELPNAINSINKPMNIKFNQVEFHYFKDVNILESVSLEIPEKKLVALVGSTGSGKSTITKLLYRLYDVSSGDILINDVSIKKYSLNCLTECIGIVPQNPVLFNNSILYNLKYAKTDATLEEIWAAIKIAQLENLINSLPHGLETKVGEFGIRLSGGERQRLAIARAVLKKPKLFIFDEATSALDNSTERVIQESLAKISQGTTTIVIAHRLTTIVNADKIFVLDKGHVVEEGTHSQLLQKGGAYSDLWNRQFETTTHSSEI